jgi:hypothetical protein
MKSLIGFCLTIAAVLLPSLGTAQIPNAGFENWTTAIPIEPTSWISTVSNVSKSTTAHTGSLAVQGVTTDAGFGFALPATLWSYFPVSQRHAKLQGYYQFAAVGGDSFSVSILMFKAGLTIGSGYGNFAGTGSSYVQFSEDIEYYSTESPDTGYIVLSVIGPSGGTAHPGSTYLGDDLSFSGTATSIAPDAAKPTEFALSQNYPNPFNPSTIVRGQSPVAGHVTIAVYDALGREVAVLMDENREPGGYEVRWDASGFASGMYICRMTAGSFLGSTRMLLLK